jgi:DNA-binding response OmpR family regulator
MVRSLHLKELQTQRTIFIRRLWKDLLMRLLVVEDDQHLAAALKRGLEAESFAVDIAATGTDGLWMANNCEYDAMIFDIMLPGMNGQKLCSTLRGSGNTTPILMLTAKDGEFDEADSLDLGADDFLSKPFSYTVLIARVRAMLRRSSSGRPRNDVLKIGDLSFDTAAHVCKKDGMEITLTAKEAAILDYLMRHIDQVVTKDELLNHVWDYAFEGGPNVVEVHVSALRRKLGAEFIETIRGSGYRISSQLRTE